LWLREIFFCAKKAQESHKIFDFEATVGISLPITDTLYSLEKSGDSVTFLEVSLSGTIGYICTSIMEGTKLSVAVSEAIKLGFTEDNPCEDLSGEDVARKSLILARELGIPISLKDVSLQSFLPSETLSKCALGDVVKVLAEYDEEFERECKKFISEGKSLRYITTINPSGTPSVKISPRWVTSDNPFIQLKKSDVMFAFTTGAYCQRPLVVQGMRAGHVVAIVLSNILKSANKFRGALV